MNGEHEQNFGGPGSLAAALRHELHHMKSHWFWFLLVGILLTVTGAAAIVVPAFTVAATLTITYILGILLMIGGVTTIASSFWIGRWGGFLVQLLVGVLYLAAGFGITEKPLQGAQVLTLFIAILFMILGSFRAISALAIRYPQWGWSLLNGTITFLAGLIISRHILIDSLWVIGLLVGLEMLFNGWTWIMIALALRHLPAEEAK